MRSTILIQFALVAITLPILAKGHTWVESIRNIANNGSFVGSEGFPRGFQSRSDPNFSDLFQTYQIENNHGSNPTLCNPHAQGPSSQGKFARLQASPGTAVALLYQENGHVTLPDTNLGKPANRGTIYIYATQQGKDNEKYYDVYQKWSADGTGGDKRGKLISTQNFDDGQCFQVNNGKISKQRQAEFKFAPSNPMGSNLWCQNNIVIPNDVDTSKLLSLYWIWKWDTAPGADPADMSGKNQTYTSCMDIELTATSPSKAAAIQFKYVQGQDVQSGGLSSLFNTLKNGNVFAVKAYTDGMTPTASNTPIYGTAAGSAPSSTAAAAATSSSPNPPDSVTSPSSPSLPQSATTSSCTSGALPPPPPKSGTSSSQESSDCAAASVATETVFIFGTSIGTAAPTGPGVVLSTYSASSPTVVTVTEVTIATKTSYVTLSGPQQSTSAAAVTFTASDSSATIPAQSQSTAAVVTQISDGQPQASALSPTTPRTSPSQASSPAPVAATTSVSASTISDNPVVDPVPTDSTASFKFQPSSTGTVTFDSSAVSTPASTISSAAAAAATTATTRPSSPIVTAAATSNQAPPPAQSSASVSQSTTASPATTPSASGTISATTFGTPLPSSIGKRCAPQTKPGAKVRRASKVFIADQSPAHAEARSHARQWRAS